MTTMSTLPTRPPWLSGAELRRLLRLAYDREPAVQTFADALGVRRETVGRWLAGRNAPTADAQLRLLSQLADVLRRADRGAARLKVARDAAIAALRPQERGKPMRLAVPLPPARDEQ
jgi:transcriptional regulator with XRE-family HTH domain